jgi:hypothetical protein
MPDTRQQCALALTTAPISLRSSGLTPRTAIAKRTRYGGSAATQELVASDFRLTMARADRGSLQTSYSQIQKPIGGRHFGPLHRATQDVDLIPKREILQLESSARSEGCRLGGGDHRALNARARSRLRRRKLHVLIQSDISDRHGCVGRDRARFLRRTPATNLIPVR